MIYQELNLAPDLSVEENIMLGQEHVAVGHRRSRRATPTGPRGARALRPCRFAAGHAGRRLSVGMQQLVEIARALASNAKVIVFDEPTSSLGPADVERLFQTIARLAARRLGRDLHQPLLEGNPPRLR